MDTHAVHHLDGVERDRARDQVAQHGLGGEGAGAERGGVDAVLVDWVA